MKKKFGTITIILIIILAIRIIGQVFAAFLSVDMINLLTPSIFGILYLMALIGVIKKQKWGSILVIVLAVIDILSAFIVGGATGVGAGIIDLILLFLAYKEYKQISS